MPPHVQRSKLSDTSAGADAQKPPGGRKNRRRQMAASSRKQSMKLPLEWTDEDASLLAGPRRGTNNNLLVSTASVLSMCALEEIFPSLERALLEDVLAAAHYQVDIAAAMLSEPVRESMVLAVRNANERAFPETDEAPETGNAVVDPAVTTERAQAIEPRQEQPKDGALDFDMVDNEDWGEVAAAGARLQPGSLLASQALLDEWEVVDGVGESLLSAAVAGV